MGNIYSRVARLNLAEVVETAEAVACSRSDSTAAAAKGA